MFMLILFDTLGNVFKQQGARKIDRVVDVRTSRRVAKTAIFSTPTYVIASKLPQLLLLTLMIHLKPVYLPNCAPSLAHGWAKCTSSICWLCFGATSPGKSC